MVTLSVGDLAADAGEERGQPGAGAGRQVEPGNRGEDRIRGDVDDPSEAARRHAVDHGFDQFERRDHVLDDAGDDLLAVEFAEAATRRAAVVVDEDVRLRAGGEERGLPLRRAHIGGDGVNRDLETTGDLLSGAVQRGAVASIDDDVAAGLGERKRAPASETAARRADDRLTA